MQKVLGGKMVHGMSAPAPTAVVVVYVVEIQQMIDSVFIEIHNVARPTVIPVRGIKSHVDGLRDPFLMDRHGG